MTLQIPIRNVWLLQLYASWLYESNGANLVAAEDNPEELPDLVARILADEVTVRLHTGLSVGIRQTTRAVTRVRGRINVLTTERHQLLSRGQISCTFDEIVTDTPANRLVKAALEGRPPSAGAATLPRARSPNGSSRGPRSKRVARHSFSHAT